MALIPEYNPIKQAIDKIMHENNPRDYLGYSQIGHPCIRYLQLYMRWAFTSKIENRIKRLFGVGHSTEHVVTKDLESIGAIVFDTQVEVIGFAGHWKGHIDGKVKNLPGCEKTVHLLEVKSHNDKSFGVLVREQSVKVAKPEHYGQLQKYMKAHKLKRGLYIGYNKNDSEYYIERVYLDEDYVKELEHKEKEVIFSNTLYPHIGNGKRSWHECKYCPAADACFDGKIEQNCRTCKFISMQEGGVWSCTNEKNEKADYYKGSIPIDLQRVGCEHYQFDEEYFNG